MGAFKLARLLSSSLVCATASNALSFDAGNGGHEVQQRRTFIGRAIKSVSLPLVAVVASSEEPKHAEAAVTDETDTFADNWWTKGLSPPKTADESSSSVRTLQQAEVPVSDEITIAIRKEDLQSTGLGLELSDVEFRTNIRVFVKSVLPGSLASRMGIQKNWVFVSLNGQSTERTNAKGVALMLSEAVKETPPQGYIEFRFRDPSVFRNTLSSLSESGGSVTTTVAPSGDTTQRNTDGSIRTGTVTSQQDQKVTVSQLVAPKMCKRGATTDDLLEISYIGSVLETGLIFDGSAIKINDKGIPGRGDDVTLYFVLGKQPFGQFPPGWDAGLYGMCVGERRRLIIPPVLAYGSKGLPRRGIGPDATLQYDITLVSLNGLSTPQ